jgi:phage FluMu protein Com
MITRCAHCRLLVESGTPALLPACPQCGGATKAVEKIEATRERPPAPRTLKFDREEGPPAR